MGQWLSWIKSNEKALLTILDNLSKKAVETSEALVVFLDDLQNTAMEKKFMNLKLKLMFLPVTSFLN